MWPKTARKMAFLITCQDHQTQLLAADAMASFLLDKFHNASACNYPSKMVIWGQPDYYNRNIKKSYLLNMEKLDFLPQPHFRVRNLHEVYPMLSTDVTQWLRCSSVTHGAPNSKIHSSVNAQYMLHPGGGTTIDLCHCFRLLHMLCIM